MVQIEKNVQSEDSGFKIERKTFLRKSIELKKISVKTKHSSPFGKILKVKSKRSKKCVLGYTQIRTFNKLVYLYVRKSDIFTKQLEMIHKSAFNY